MQIVLHVYYLFGLGQETPSNDHQALKATLGALFQLLVYSNSALNPFIYAFMSVNFRSNFRETFKCDKMFTLFRHFFHRLSTHHRPPQTSTPHHGIDKSSQATALPTKINKNNNTRATPSPLVGENKKFIELSNPFSTTNRT